MTSSYKNLLSPIQIGKLTLKNRSVLPGLTSNFSGENGEVTDQLIQFLKRRAEGGVGLIFVESVFVDWSGKGTPRQLGIHDDQLIPGLKKLTSAVHEAGAKIMPQLMHCGRQMTSAFSQRPILAPSAIADPVVSVVPVEMTKNDIKYMVKQFAESARRAKDANFDGIEIQAGHGYLISNFLSSYANDRKDEYGGSFENRMRFLEEILEETRKLVGYDFPIVCRMNAEEYVENGIHLSESIEMAKRMEQLSVDVIDVSVSVKESYHYLSVTSGEPTANQANLAAEIKKNVSIPVITAGRIISPQIAENVLREQKADLVAIGRGFISDPDFMLKASKNQEEKIIPCIGCNACNARSHRPQIICTVNSSVGRESLLEEKEVNTQKLSVGIVGSSIAGLEAAKVASEYGNHITIFEPTDQLGGLLGNIRSRIPGQEELGKATIYYQKLLSRRDNVTIHYHSEIDPIEIKNKGFDILYIALAGHIKPRYQRIDAPFAIEMIQKRTFQENEITVIGNGILAAETSLYLAGMGLDVSIVVDKEVLIPDAHPTIRYFTVERLKKNGVKVIFEEEITEDTFNKYHNPIQTHDFEDESLKVLFNDCANHVVYLGDSYESSNLAERVWKAGELLNFELERKI